MKDADFETRVLAEAATLRDLAALANSIAARRRADQDFFAAEQYDRRAEALRCAASVAETRGVMA